MKWYRKVLKEAQRTLCFFIFLSETLRTDLSAFALPALPAGRFAILFQTLKLN
jgi:hypothetical protein